MNKTTVIRFSWHYAEMVVAMLAGMFLLAPVSEFIFTQAGWATAYERPDVAALVMATNMTIGMSLWMRLRKHGWPEIADMALAMYIPFLLLFVPFWTGLISGHVVMTAGHILMFPAMFLAMLRRRNCYV
ncbi:hypothetical protein JOF56_000725 [Kibdelosporangium banguiense]|uniref:Flagellar biosynthetic protein FliP n=1 Tax=Kibdelosporangium banguiense TaxID=1365924 RepID=A0ABS4T7F2_9PSEU|nr:hypothetical protein [Kibdelosporangium banguiense]MBP2320340.1 hypothetical protein [Kibdelosporangium banguiense]